MCNIRWVQGKDGMCMHKEKNMHEQVLCQIYRSTTTLKPVKKKKKECRAMIMIIFTFDS